VGEAGEDDASVIYTDVYTRGAHDAPGLSWLRGTKSVAYECSGENASATAGGASAILSSLGRSSSYS
jgi:hypothetical protein